MVTLTPQLLYAWYVLSMGLWLVLVLTRANWTFWRREKSLLLGTTQFPEPFIL
jgi:hypothetical protein